MRTNRNLIEFHDRVVHRYPLTAADRSDLPQIAARHEAAREHGLPVPRVLALHEDHLELERMQGSPVMTTRLTASAQDRLGRDLASFTAALRCLTTWPLPATPWPELWGVLHEAAPCPQTQQAFQVAAGVTTTVTHGDLSGGNLLVSADGALTGVIDWDGATLGDPAQDFSALCANVPEQVAVTLRAQTPQSAELLARAEVYLNTWPVQDTLWRRGEHPWINGSVVAGDGR